MQTKKLFYKIIGVPDFLINRIILLIRGVTFGRNFNISGRIFVRSNSKNGIIIGDNVKINSSRASNPIGGDIKTILFAKNNGKIFVGNNVGLSNTTIFSCDSVKIGDNVLIGGNTKIYDTDFHWLDFHKRTNELGGKSDPIEIKDGAFVGAHCIILKGVTIGRCSIIGAGSVLTKSVPDYEIWAGNPARFIKKIKE